MNVDYSKSLVSTEESEAKRLIDKKPPPSRKRREKRAPRHNQRRNRMKVDDPDISKRDSDLSLSCDIETSYKSINFKSMLNRLATPNGIVEQGHPSGPTNTGWKSIDKINLLPSHFDSIISYAKNLLKDDWFLHCWSGGSDDAPFRAALDISIHTADDSIYQSKIDVETYNFLLGSLMGSGIDQFSDTFYTSSKNKRSASTMYQNEHTKNIVRIASEIRLSNPKASIEILKNLRQIAQEMPVSQEQQQAQQQQQGQKEVDLDEKTTKEMDKKAKGLLQAISKGDGEEFVDNMKELSQLLPKTASSRLSFRIAASDLESIVDMDDDQLKEFLKSQKKPVDNLKKSLEDGDVEAILKSIDDMEEQVQKDLQEFLKKHLSSSIRVSISTLVNVAGTSAEARTLLLPFLAAAKKKVVMKKKSKKDEDEKEEKEEKTSSKKKPAKKAMKPKKKVSSFIVKASDSDW